MFLLWSLLRERNSLHLLNAQYTQRSFWSTSKGRVKKYQEGKCFPLLFFFQKPHWTKK